MPVTTSYPGIYIEELPSTSHTITPAPTSVTVFIGYTNPFWRIGPTAELPPFNQAVEVNSFADYQANFGGFFSWPPLRDYVGQAVSQFFLNGGSQGYVVALQASDPSLSPPGFETATATLEETVSPPGSAFVFSALQPIGLPGPTPDETLGVPMSLTLSNISDATADLTIIYGTTVETYRKVQIGSLVATVNNASSLVNVALATGATPGSFETLQVAGSSPPGGGSSQITADFNYASPPDSSVSLVDYADFIPAFAANAPLDKVPVFNLMVLPGVSDPSTLAEALSYCEAKRAFFIMDPPANAVADSLATLLADAPADAETIEDIVNGNATTPAPPLSKNGALYFPYLTTTDPVMQQPIASPPSGFVAGIFASEDVNRGVWKSPAGLETTILGTTGVVDYGVLTDPQQGDLNPLGINCIRTFPGIGSVVFGARTLVTNNLAFEQWRYVAVRRTALFIEQTLYSQLRWAIFEPNAEPLWTALRQEVAAFMLGLYRQGAFAGTKASDAFLVQCDSTTTSASDIANGVVNILVGFAPLSPAEFVVVQIQQLAGQSQT